MMNIFLTPFHWHSIYYVFFWFLLLLLLTHLYLSYRRDKYNFFFVLFIFLFNFALFIFFCNLFRTEAGLFCEERERGGVEISVVCVDCRCRRIDFVCACVCVWVRSHNHFLWHLRWMGVKRFGFCTSTTIYILWVRSFVFRSLCNSIPTRCIFSSSLFFFFFCHTRFSSSTQLWILFWIYANVII